MAVEDLNSVVLTGQATKAPVHDSEAWSFLEIAVRNGGSICYLVLHVPGALRHSLYGVGIGDKVLARGELAYSRSDHGGQHVIKTSDIRRLSANGRGLEAAEGLPESLMPLTRTLSDGENPPVSGDQPSGDKHYPPVGDRRRRQRKRRARPERS
jgi:hypothetical protein